MSNGNPSSVPGRPLRLTICTLYGAVVAVLSLMPSQSLDVMPYEIPHLDKIGHFVMYGAFAWLILWALRPKAMPGWTPAIGSILFCVVFGLTMELLQKFCTGSRAFSAWDIVANVLGATVFVLIRMRNVARQSA